MRPALFWGIAPPLRLEKKTQFYLISRSQGRQVQASERPVSSALPEARISCIYASPEGLAPSNTMVPTSGRIYRAVQAAIGVSRRA